MGWWDRDQEAQCLGESSPPAFARTYEERNAILRSIGFEDYRSYLASDLWAGISKRVLSSGRRCWVCRRRKSATQCHHDVYTRRNLLGETLEGIYPACAICHPALEFKGKTKRSLIEARAECRRLRNWKKWPKIVARKLKGYRRRRRKRRKPRFIRELDEIDAELDRLIARD